MTKILVPLDGSELSREALPVADWLAQNLHAEVVLLSVGITPETPEQAEETDARLRRVTSKTGDYFEGLSVRERTDKGRDPVSGILEAAQEEGVDLVVMATEGRSGLADLAQRSVSEEVVRAGVVPVTLVCPRNGG